MKTVPYGHQSISQKDINAVIKTLKSDYLTQGPKIDEFEKALAKYTGAKYAVIFNSGTAALHSAYFALGLKPDDEVITSPITFAATSNAALYLQAKPVFVDIDPLTGNIDPSKIEEAITKKTKLIIPIHYGGMPVDMKNIQVLAKKYNLYIVEDACHALGAKYENEKIGSCKYSNMATFSFHPVKHITTGEGGAVTTNNKKYYEKMQQFKTHGISKHNFKNKSKEASGSWYYEMQELGFNYRMSDIAATLGLTQLKKLNEFLEKRRKIASIYNHAFIDNPYFDIPEESSNISAYHLYPIRLKPEYKNQKNEIFKRMRENGLGVQVHYIPVYLHPYYQQLGYKKGSCKNAEDFYRQEISIPIYPGLSVKDVHKVINLILKIFKEQKHNLN